MSEDKFDYTYSAPTENERREIEGIKKQYVVAPKTESKLESLRSLNKKVNRPPTVISCIIGIIGTLIMGVGMTLVLEWNNMVAGVIVGVTGVAIAATAYPVYTAVLKRNKQKYGRQIIELSNELLNNTDE